MSDQTSGPQAAEVPAAEVELDRKAQELLDSIAYIRAWLDRQREKHMMASDQSRDDADRLRTSGIEGKYIDL